MTRLVSHLLRSLAALLLALAIASPALAEIGCKADALVHMADEAPVHDAALDDGDPQSPDRDTHCAFAHGGGLGPAPTALSRPAMVIAYHDRLFVDRFSAHRLALERPPRG